MKRPFEEEISTLDISLDIQDYNGAMFRNQDRDTFRFGWLISRVIYRRIVMVLEFRDIIRLKVGFLNKCNVCLGCAESVQQLRSFLRCVETANV